MSLNTLLEHGRTAAEYGRGLAERAPYSLVALVSRFAVASAWPLPEVVVDNRTKELSVAGFL